MTKYSAAIIGCGDVGKRIVAQLLESGTKANAVLALVQSLHSAAKCRELDIATQQFDLDKCNSNLEGLNQTMCVYLVPPQKQGIKDRRTQTFLSNLVEQTVTPSKVVLISTTGVYGDCAGEWVTEQSETQPQTERGKRRLDSEQQWTNWSEQTGVPLVILRVPGIYANSRLPRQRIEQGIAVVRAEECGYSNRIHADDLATISIAAMHSALVNNKQMEVYNACDGTPGKITEYLQAAAEELGLPALPEISMRDAQHSLSAGMLSYLGESRKISNKKMLSQLDVKLRYPNFREGLKFG